MRCMGAHGWERALDLLEEAWRSGDNPHGAEWKLLDEIPHTLMCLGGLDPNMITYGAPANACEKVTQSSACVRRVAISDKILRRRERQREKEREKTAWGGMEIIR